MDNVALTSSPASSIQYPYKVKISWLQPNYYWEWCAKNIALSEWIMMIGLGRTSPVYCFASAEDAVAFKLKFGL